MEEAGIEASQGKSSRSLDFIEVKDNINKKDLEYKLFPARNKINTFNKNGDQTSIKNDFLSIPSLSNTPENSSNNDLIEDANFETLPTDVVADLSIPKNKSYLFFKKLREDLSSSQTALASCKIEGNNSSLPHISIVSQKCACTENTYLKRSEETTKYKHNTNPSVTDLVYHDLKSSIEGDKFVENQIENNIILEESVVNIINIENNETFVSDDEVQCLSQMSLENPSEVPVVDCIFTEIFKEMEEIENYISAYISSFYMWEEEYENYSVLNKSSSEIMSHFFQQLHSPTKVKNSQCKNSNCTRTSNSNVILQESNKPKNEVPLFNENSITKSPEKKGNSNLLIKKRSTNHCIDVKTSNSVLAGSVKMNQHIIDESNYLKLDNSFSQENMIGYYIRGENDPVSDLFSKEDITINHSSNIITPENKIPLIKNHKALIPIRFFENIWKEFIESVNLVNGVKTFNSYSADKSFFSYGHWMKIYDQNILEEAENVLDSIDSFVTNGCFPLQENISSNRSPSSITEFDHFDQNSIIKEDYNFVSPTVFMTSSEEHTDRYEGKYKSCNQTLSYPEKCVEQMNKQSLCSDSNNMETEDIICKNHSTGNRCTKIEDKNSEFNGTIINEYKALVDSEKFLKTSPYLTKGLDNTDKNTFKQIANNSDSLCTNTLNSMVKVKTENKETKAELRSPSNLAMNDNSIAKTSEILKKKNVHNIFNTKLNFDNIEVEKSVITINKRCNYLHDTNESEKTEKHHLHFRQPNQENIFHKIEHEEVMKNDENMYNLPKRSLLEESISKSRTVLEEKSKVLFDNQLVSQNSTNIIPQKRTSWSKSWENESNNTKLKHDQSSLSPEDSYHQPRSQFLFSSPNVQLNLTNPIMNVNKK